jgi:hypothetical protein
MTNTELSKRWETRIAEFKASGQSATVWCANNNLKIHQLRYWLRKFKAAEKTTFSSSQWLSVEVGEAPSDSDTLAIKVGKVTIEVRPGFDPQLLAKVVRTILTL